ncbi:hypothetical protein RhiirA1_447920 [Rhizophagus irregularis]|uniref:Uncharacterized protein n=1 Tax=Rhizophagus irregularis TaxID=588596 RepID=A0A2N0SKS9_9GLOM|nr:hypothetical protein RhiirA1_447920 [Rhizophagus irregularis]CAG8713560.1 17500_t:CDS:2 [Rhizophagus irregularis]
MDQCVSELVPSLNFTELKINILGLDYIELGGRLEPTKDVIAINSNFTHKAFEGYEQFLTKPKVFGSLEPVDIFLHYLAKCSLPKFSSVELVGGSKPLLLNYRFAVNIGDNKFIDLTSLAYILESNNGIQEKLPFSIKYIKHDVGDVHSKIAIIFTSKIRVHIWPKSGKNYVE